MLALYDSVKVEEFTIGEKKPFNTTIGYILGFPRARMIRGSGYGNTFKLEVQKEKIITWGSGGEFSIPQFRLRRDDFGRVWARIPRATTMQNGMVDVQISCLSESDILTELT